MKSNTCSLESLPLLAREAMLAPIYIVQRASIVLETLLAVGCIICLGQKQEDDRRVISKSLGLSNYSLLSKLGPKQAIVSTSWFSDPFHAEIDCSPDLDKGISDREVAEIMNPIWEKLKAQITVYSNDPINIEMKKETSGPEKPNETVLFKNTNARCLFMRRFHYPIETISTSYSHLEILGGAGTRALQELENNGFIEIVKVHPGGRSAELIYALPTQKGCEFYGVKYNPLPGRSTLMETRIWQALIAKWCLKNGYESAIVEGTIPGSSKNIDVLAVKDGRFYCFEVSNTDSANHVLDQILKDFELGSYEIIVCKKNQADLTKYQKIIMAQIPENLRLRVKFKLLRNFIEKGEN